MCVLCGERLVCKRVQLGLPSEDLVSAALQLPKPNTS